MGLDQFFEKRHIIWHGSGKRPKSTIEVFEGGYFRKFNALHGWIVDCCAEGVDNCKPIEVEQEKLEALLEVLTKVHEDHDLADDLLPLTDGFFFGNRRDEQGNLIVEYDEYYFEDVADAIVVVEDLIEWLTTDAGDNWHEVVYQASW